MRLRVLAVFLICLTVAVLSGAARFISSDGASRPLVLLDALFLMGVAFAVSCVIVVGVTSLRRSVHTEIDRLDDTRRSR